MNEEAARARFMRLRWRDGRPRCPSCGGAEHYVLSGTDKYRCASCLKHFSPTTGTSFHSRKVPYSAIIAAVDLFDAGANADTVARLLGLTPKTAQSWQEKVAALREAA